MFVKGLPLVIGMARALPRLGAEPAPAASAVSVPPDSGPPSGNSGATGGGEGLLNIMCAVSY